MLRPGAPFSQDSHGMVLRSHSAITPGPRSGLLLLELLRSKLQKSVACAALCEQAKLCHAGRLCEIGVDAVVVSVSQVYI